MEQKLILQNNAKENAKQIPHSYRVGDKVMIKLPTGQKHDTDTYTGPHRIVTVNDNGTVKLKWDILGGTVFETWNIQNLDPCIA